VPALGGWVCMPTRTDDVFFMRTVAV